MLELLAGVDVLGRVALQPQQVHHRVRVGLAPLRLLLRAPAGPQEVVHVGQHLHAGGHDCRVRPPQAEQLRARRRAGQEALHRWAVRLSPRRPAPRQPLRRVHRQRCQWAAQRPHQGAHGLGEDVRAAAEAHGEGAEAEGTEAVHVEGQVVPILLRHPHRVEAVLQVEAEHVVPLRHRARQVLQRLEAAAEAAEVRVDVP